MLEQGSCDGVSLLMLGSKRTVASILGALSPLLGSHSLEELVPVSQGGLSRSLGGETGTWPPPQK